MVILKILYGLGDFGLLFLTLFFIDHYEIRGGWIGVCFVIFFIVVILYTIAGMKFFAKTPDSES